jgi:glutamate-1-semialdehyde 2,1-aminomutase
MKTSPFQTSDRLRSRAHAAIPGGAHTYAKGDDQYPVLAPGFIDRGLGSHVWDVDGNEYIEFGMGNRAVGLGHAHPAVVDAARRALELGSNFTRPHRIELQCAETFLGMVPGAEMVKFCKDGSDATSGAVRLARAHTGRDLIGYCVEHPFFSTDDWFIGTTPVNSGIPEQIRALSVPFRYGDLASAAHLFQRHDGRIAALILEPSRGDDPPAGYLQGLQALCHANGALLILDEMITGFRWHAGGAQTLYGVVPDLACFGKALANGFSVSALAGRREIMRLGGLDHVDRPRVFLLSTTHGGETHALAAAIATMSIYAQEPVIEHLYRQGAALRAGIEAAARALGIGHSFRVVGRDCCLAYATLDPSGKPSQPLRTLFLQETIRRGLLAPSLVVSYAHSDEDIARTIDAVTGALQVYAQALEDGVERHLVGRPTEVVYRAFNTAPAGRGAADARA